MNAVEEKVLYTFRCSATLKEGEVKCTVLAESHIKAKIKAAIKWNIKTKYVHAWMDN